MRWAFIICIAAVFLIKSISSSNALTGLQALVLAQKKVPLDIRANVIKIHGKSAYGEVMPSKWDILFYDKQAPSHAWFVQVKGSKVVRVKQGGVEFLRLASYKPEEIVHPKYFNIDSDTAFEIVQRSPELYAIPLSSVNMSLYKRDKKKPSSALWRLTLYAKHRNTGAEVEIGDAHVWASSGKLRSVDVDPYKLLKCND